MPDEFPAILGPLRKGGKCYNHGQRGCPTGVHSPQESNMPALWAATEEGGHEQRDRRGTLLH